MSEDTTLPWFSQHRKNKTLPLNVNSGHLRLLMRFCRRERSSELYSLSVFCPVCSLSRKSASTSYMGRDVWSWFTRSCNIATHWVFKTTQHKTLQKHNLFKILLKNVHPTSILHPKYLSKFLFQRMCKYKAVLRPFRFLVRKASSVTVQAVWRVSELCGGECSHSETPELAEEQKSTPQTLLSPSLQQSAWPAMHTHSQSVSHKEKKRNLIQRSDVKTSFNSQVMTSTYRIALSGRLHAGQVFG